MARSAARSRRGEVPLARDRAAALCCPRVPPRTPQLLAAYLADLRRRSREHGGECLEDECVGLTSPMRFKCAAGHQWTTQGRIIRTGSWCPICAGKERVTHAQMQRRARALGGELLARTVPDTKTPLRWRCADGHEWVTPASKIRCGSWCPRCAGQTLLQDLQEFAGKRGGLCLSRAYVNGNTPMRWRCAEGHTFTAIWRVVKLGRWCGDCKAVRRRLTIAGMRSLAAERGGECLAPDYLGTNTRLRWRCAAGHEFDATPGSVRSGRWCATCGNRVLGLEFVQQMARERGGRCLASKYVNGRELLTWECGEGHRWRASTDNVRHRGSWCRRCATARNLVEVRRRGLERMQALAAERGGRCLSTEFVNDSTELQWECAEGHRWSALPRWLRYKVWCPKCRGQPKITEAWQTALAQAKQRGGACLGGRNRSTHQVARWRCAAGHEFTNSPYRIAAGRWCPLCSGHRLSIEHMRAMAEERGGRCISRKYVDARTKLQWECDRGHRWWAMPGGLRNAGSWCPQCAWDRLSELRRSDARDRR
jgi:hypothetical protein